MYFLLLVFNSFEGKAHLFILVSRRNRAFLITLYRWQVWKILMISRTFWYENLKPLGHYIKSDVIKSEVSASSFSGGMERRPEGLASSWIPVVSIIWFSSVMNNTQRFKVCMSKYSWKLSNTSKQVNEF